MSGCGRGCEWQWKEALGRQGLNEGLNEYDTPLRQSSAAVAKVAASVMRRRLRSFMVGLIVVVVLVVVGRRAGCMLVLEMLR